MAFFYLSYIVFVYLSIMYYGSLIYYIINYLMDYLYIDEKLLENYLCGIGKRYGGAMKP